MFDWLWGKGKQPCPHPYWMLTNIWNSYYIAGSDGSLIKVDFVKCTNCSETRSVIDGKVSTRGEIK